MRLNKLAFFPVCFLCIFLLACAGNTPAAKPKSLSKQAEASRKVGEAYMNGGNYTLALKELLKAQSLNAGDPYLQNDLGLTYMAKKRLNQAIAHFQRAIALKPDFSAARNNLGTVYMALGKWDTAIATFNQVLEDILYTTPHLAQVNLGFAYFSKRNYAKAEEHYKAALFNQPRYVTAMRGLAGTYMAMGRMREAIQWYEKAIRITPRFVQLYLDIAKAYAAVNKTKAALDAYRKVVAIAPDTPSAEEAQRGAQRLKRGG